MEPHAMKKHCRETLERAYLFLDGEVLTESERSDIQLHLEGCSPCYQRYGLDREITLVVARLQGRARCPRELRLRIMGLLEE
jgi:mycothiol system anti-sigma-R factor